ncbi:hypothetical protein [uncultured Mucilaginibacter sp.]|nr:hypothetical protein [uncultured Mucilaginibacter sp.]
MLTQRCETTYRLELSHYCSKYGVEHLNVYQLCQEYHLTREQLYFHLSL